MRVSSSTFPDNFLYQDNLLQAQQNSLQQQATTGLKFSLPEDNPAGMSEVLNLQASSSANQQYQTNISDLQSQASNVSGLLTSLQAIVSQAGQIVTSADGTATPTEMTTYATEVGNLIQQALQLGNSKDSQGNYIFGGTATGSPPFTATTDSNGNVTGVTYNGNSTVNQVEISPGVTVSAQIPGANTTGSGADGLFVNSANGADLFSHLISLQQDIASDNTAAISTTDTQNISKDETNVLGQVSTNGVLLSQLQATGSLATLQGNNMTTQISGKTDADLATTITHLQQTETAYEAALESSSRVMEISLVDFLT